MKNYKKYAHMKCSKRGKMFKEIIQLQKPILLWENMKKNTFVWICHLTTN